VAVFGLDGKFLRMLQAAHDQHNIKLKYPYNALPSADGNILVADDDGFWLFSSDGLFLKEVKPPELGSDENWGPSCMHSGTQGELVTVEGDDDWTVCMRDADCGLLWSVEEPELTDSTIVMDYKGRLLCKPRNRDVEVWEVEFHDGS
jgi:hypothetical protein